MMQTLIQRSKIQLNQLREILYAVYLVGMIVLTLVLVMEIKLYFQIDLLPGMDIPLDEWYASAFGK